MSGTVRFILGGIVAALGLWALVGAAEAESGPLYYAGLAVFVGAVAYDFNLIRQTYDEYERSRRNRSD